MKVGDKQIFLYGNSVENTTEIKIYTSPKIFDKITLSSLEGIFVQGCDESSPRCLANLIPQVAVKKDVLQDFELRYDGQFVPF